MSEQTRARLVDLAVQLHGELNRDDTAAAVATADQMVTGLAELRCTITGRCLDVEGDVWTLRANGRWSMHTTPGDSIGSYTWAELAEECGPLQAVTS